MLTGQIPPFGEDDESDSESKDMTENDDETLDYSKFAIPNNLSSNCYDLLRKMIKVDPIERINVLDAIHHPWVKASQE
jgi:serine/threonine protein kinase